MKIAAPFLFATGATLVHVGLAWWVSRFRKTRRWFENAFDFFAPKNYTPPGDRFAPLLALTALSAVITWFWALLSMSRN